MNDLLEESRGFSTYGLDHLLSRDGVPSLDVIASEVARMARQQPALVMGGALLVGMWLTRAWSTSSGGVNDEPPHARASATLQSGRTGSAPATSIDERASRATGVWAPLGRMYF